MPNTDYCFSRAVATAAVNFAHAWSLRVAGCHERERGCGFNDARRCLPEAGAGDRSPWEAKPPPCAPCVPWLQPKRLSCCNMHFNHAMLAPNQMDTMPSQREGQGFESP